MTGSASAHDRLPHEEVAAAWRDRREPTAFVHATSASAGRTSIAVRRRIAEHHDLESTVDAYVAAGRAATGVGGLRSALGELTGFGADEFALTENASGALALLLRALPRLAGGGEIWALRSEWGPNLAAFADVGLRVEWLDEDDAGLVDLTALETRLRGPSPAAVHLVALASHRALVQPIGAAAALCDAAGVPLVVDAAQALGHVAIEPGAAAIYGTGRKWLCGPRGVGYLGVREPWQSTLHPVTPALAGSNWPGDDRPIDRLTSRDAFIAGRLGLATAVEEYVSSGPSAVHERLSAIGALLRGALAEVPGWALVDEVDAPTAIVALRPLAAGADVPAAVAALESRGVLATACPWHRAPAELAQGSWLLRFSPHIGTSADDVERIAAAMRELPATA